MAGANWRILDAQHPDLDLLRLPFRKFLNIVWLWGFQIWYQDEIGRRTAGITDPKARDMIPKPTFKDWDRELERDPDAPETEDEFFDDYAGAGA